MTFRTPDGRSIHRATRTHGDHVDQFTFYIYRVFAQTEYIISLYFLFVHLVLSLLCVYYIRILYRNVCVVVSNNLNAYMVSVE